MVSYQNMESLYSGSGRSLYDKMRREGIGRADLSQFVVHPKPEPEATVEPQESVKITPEAPPQAEVKETVAQEAPPAKIQAPVTEETTPPVPTVLAEGMNDQDSPSSPESLYWEMRQGGMGRADLDQFVVDPRASQPQVVDEAPAPVPTTIAEVGEPPANEAAVEPTTPKAPEALVLDLGSDIDEPANSKAPEEAPEPAEQIKTTENLPVVYDEPKLPVVYQEPAPPVLPEKAEEQPTTEPTVQAPVPPPDEQNFFADAAQEEVSEPVLEEPEPLVLDLGSEEPSPVQEPTVTTEEPIQAEQPIQAEKPAPTLAELPLLGDMMPTEGQSPPDTPSLPPPPVVNDTQPRRHRQTPSRPKSRSHRRPSRATKTPRIFTTRCNKGGWAGVAWTTWPSPIRTRPSRSRLPRSRKTRSSSPRR